MEIGNKAVAAASAGLFILGGLSVYLLMSTKSATEETTARKHRPAIIAKLEQELPKKAIASSSISSNTDSTDAATQEMTHAAFLAEAEAKRAQHMEDKAEADRLEKLRRIKKNSVECKFWKQQQQQQQKSSSAVAKIEANNEEHCELTGDSSSDSSVSTSDADSSSSGVVTK